MLLTHVSSMPQKNTEMAETERTPFSKFVFDLHGTVYDMPTDPEKKSKSKLFVVGRGPVGTVNAAGRMQLENGKSLVCPDHLACVVTS